MCSMVKLLLSSLLMVLKVWLYFFRIFLVAIALDDTNTSKGDEQLHLMLEGLTSVPSISTVSHWMLADAISVNCSKSFLESM